MLDFEKFVMLTEKYAPSFHFDSQKFLVADECDYAVARYVYYDPDEDSEDSEEGNYYSCPNTGPDSPGYVDIAYNFDFDAETYAIYPINLRGKKLVKWNSYDELYDEETVAVRLQSLERRYYDCINKRDEFKADMEQEEREEEAKKYDLPLISW